jgi:transposase
MGAKVGFPRFKKKAKARLSCRFTTGAIRLEADRRHVTLPRLGTIRTHESTRKLQRRLAGGRARVLSATVSRESDGRWFVPLQVEVQRGRGQVARPGTVAGVDLGIRHLAVLADSTGAVSFEPHLQHLQRAQAALRRANRTPARRQGPVVFDAETGKKAYRAPSANWLEAKAALGKAHARVRHLREDALHQLTTRVAGTYGTVVVEDLNVAGMLKNGSLARHVAGAGFGTVRRQLACKTGWMGGELIVAVGQKQPAGVLEQLPQGHFAPARREAGQVLGDGAAATSRPRLTRLRATAPLNAFATLAILIWSSIMGGLPVSTSPTPARTTTVRPSLRSTTMAPGGPPAWRTRSSKRRCSR